MVTGWIEYDCGVTMNLYIDGCELMHSLLSVNGLALSWVSWAFDD